MSPTDGEFPSAEGNECHSSATCCLDSPGAPLLRCGGGLLGSAGRRGVRTRFASASAGGNLAATCRQSWHHADGSRGWTWTGDPHRARPAAPGHHRPQLREQCGTGCPNHSVPGLRMRLIMGLPRSSVCSGKRTTVPALSWWPLANTQAVIATGGQVGRDTLRSSGKVRAKLPGRRWSPGPGQGRAPASFSGCGTRDLPPALPLLKFVMFVFIRPCSSNHTLCVGSACCYGWRFGLVNHWSNQQRRK